MRSIGLACVLLLGCGFRAPQGANTDAGTNGGDGPGSLDAPDGTPIDGPPSPNTRTRRLDIVDAQVAGGPHASFPLLVSITADWLRTTAAGGDVVNPNGFDIGFFADAAGTTRLAHEVELYNATAGALVAWVRVPSLSATTELFLRYGDSTITTNQQDVPAVWSANFAAVWHMGGVADSTANNNGGTDAGTTSAGGQIGSARSFNGQANSISVGSGASIDDLFVGGGTVEAWFRATTWGGGELGRVIEKGNATSDLSGWALCVDDVNAPRSFRFMHASTGGPVLRGAWNTSGNSVALNTWTHVAVVYDRGSTANDPVMYINGAAATVSEIGPPGGAMVSDATFNTRVGNREAGDRAFNGLIDELRLSTDPRSAGWIQTSFRNQSAPGTFLTISNPL